MTYFKKYIKVILFSLLLLPIVSFASNESVTASSETPFMPGNVISFYSAIGNFYYDSITGSFSNLKDLLVASASFYKELPKQVVTVYVGIGDATVNLSYRSVDGLAGIGNLTLSGAVQGSDSIASVGDFYSVLGDISSRFFSK